MSHVTLEQAKQKFLPLVAIGIEVVGSPYLLVVNRNPGLPDHVAPFFELEATDFVSPPPTRDIVEFIQRQVRTNTVGVCCPSFGVIYVCLHEGVPHGEWLLAHEWAHALESAISRDHSTSEAGALLLGDVTLAFLRTDLIPRLLDMGVTLKRSPWATSAVTLANAPEASTVERDALAVPRLSREAEDANLDGDRWDALS